MTEILPNNTKVLLPSWYYDAFGLKIMGLTYKAIAERTGKSESHIKLLFSKKGVLYQFYREYVQERKDDSIEDSLDMMFAHLPDYTRAAITVARDTKNPMGVRQREHLFNMTLGKPTENVKINASLAYGTFSDWVKAETLKEQDNGQEQDKGISEGSE